MPAMNWGLWRMREYRLYCLDGADKFTKVYEIDAVNDAEALVKARRAKPPYQVRTVGTWTQGFRARPSLRQLIAHLLRAALLSLQPRDVGLALVDDFLDYLDHARIVREADDLTKLLNAATHPGDRTIMHPAAK